MPGGQIATAFVRILPDLTGFQEQVETATFAVGDGIAASVQDGVAASTGQLSLLDDDFGSVAEGIDTKMGAAMDGMAAEVQAGVDKSAVALTELSDTAAASADKVAASGAKSAAGFGGFSSKLIGGTLIASVGAIAEKAGIKAATALQTLQVELGLTSTQTEKLSLVADAAGISVSKLGLMAGRLDKNITSAQESTSKTGTSFTKILDATGVSLAKLAASSFPEQLQLIAEGYDNAKTKAEGATLVQAAFGRGGLQLLPLIANYAALDKVAGELKLPKMDTKSAETAGMEFKLLVGYVEMLVEALVLKLAPAAERVAESIIKVVTPIADFISGSRAAQVAIEALGTAFLAYKIVQLMSAAFDALDGAMDANPIGLVVAALAALGIALYEAYQHSQTFRDIVNAAFNDVRGVVDSVVTYLEGLWAEFGGRITADAQTTWTEVEAVVREVFGAVEEIVTSTVSVLEALWKMFGGTITSVAHSAWDLVKTDVETTMAIIEDVIKIALDLIHGNWSAAWDAIKNLVVTAIEGVINEIRDQIAIFLAIAGAIGSAILKGLGDALTGLKDLIVKALDVIKDALESVAGDAVGWAEGIGSSIIQGIEKGFGGLLGDLKSKAESGLKSVVSDLNPFSPVSHGGEMYIGQPLAQGAIDGYEAAIAPLASIINLSLQRAVLGTTVPSVSQPGATAALGEFGASTRPVGVLTPSDIDDLRQAFSDANRPVVDAVDKNTSAVTASATTVTVTPDLTANKVAQAAAR